MIFRNAVPREARELTKLTFSSKQYWGYPDEWMAIWTDELTITPEYIKKNMVVLAEENIELLGYISIVEHTSNQALTVGEYHISGGFFLDNTFVHPLHIGKGIGGKLMDIAFDWCRENSIRKLYVYSDPNAKGFYEKMGAVYLGEAASDNAVRTLPFLAFSF
jgi:GNAT superfamily N-acetyltransferase